MSVTTATPRQKLYLDSDSCTADSFSVDGGNVVAFCRRCPGKMEPNDDSAAVLQTRSGALVLVAADGVGGCPLGYKASQIAVESIAETVEAADPMADLRPAILDGFERANDEIIDLAVGAATTLTVVEVVDGRARSYQVGDSMTVIVGQRGALKWKSTPHSPVGYAIESGMLDESEAMYHEERHLVSNLVGLRSMHIDIGPAYSLAARDTIIAGSDGLFDNLHLSEILEIGRSGKPVDRMNRLIELATTRMSQFESGVPGKPDDLTVLIYVPDTSA